MARNLSIQPLFIVGVGTGMLLALLLLQMHQVSRYWLRRLARTLRKRISPSFDLRPNVHADLPTPREIQVAEDASLHNKFDGYIMRAVLSVMYGVEQVDFYVMRRFIMFVIEAVLLIILSIVLGFIARL